MVISIANIPPPPKSAYGCWVLAAFGSGELLAIAIPTLIPLVFLLSLDFPCLCNDDIKY